MAPSRHPRRWAVAFLGVLALILGACSGGSDAEDDPRAVLQEAIDDLGTWDGIELDVRVELDETAQASVLAEGELTAEELEVLLNSSIRITGTGDGTEGSGAFVLTLGGQEALEARVTGDERLFLRLDLEAITAVAEDADIDDLDVDELVVAARMFGLGDVATAIVDGDWVEIIGLDDLAELSGTDTDPEAELDDAQAQALAERFTAEFEQLVADAEVTFLGTEDAGDRIRVTASGEDVARVLDTLTAELAELVGDDLAGDLGGPDELLREVEGSPVSLDLWVDGGSFTQVGVDASTLEDAEEIDGEVLILVGLQEVSTAIAVPDDAVTFDVLELFGAFFGGLGGAFGDDLFADEDLFFDDPGDEDPFLEDAPAGDGAADPDADGGTEDIDDGTTDVEDGTDDALEDGFDESFDEGFGDPECITDAELEEFAEFFGEEALEEFEELFEMGLLERC